MFERAPERQTFLTPYEQKLVSKFEKQKRRRLRATLSSYAVSLSVAIGTHAYMTDVTENMHEQHDVKMSVETIQEVDSDYFTTFSNGFFSLDANSLAEKIGPAVQQVIPSSIESLNAGDAARDPAEIAQNIIKYAEENNKTSVSLFGYSVGGIETLKAAVKIIHESDLRIDLIYLAATPDSLESLQPEKRLQQDIFTSALTLIPWSEHSDYVKFALTMGISTDSFVHNDTFDPAAFGRTWERVWNEVEEEKHPSTSTLEYQINLAKSDIRKDIHMLAESEGTYTPPLIYLRIPHDSTVSSQAGEKICAYAEEVFIPCVVIDLQSENFTTHHDLYYTDESVAVYEETLANAKDTIRDLMIAQDYLYDQKIDHALNEADAAAITPGSAHAR